MHVALLAFQSNFDRGLTFLVIPRARSAPRRQNYDEPLDLIRDEVPSPKRGGKKRTNRELWFIEKIRLHRGLSINNNNNNNEGNDTSASSPRRETRDTGWAGCIEFQALNTKIATHFPSAATLPSTFPPVFVDYPCPAFGIVAPPLTRERAPPNQ